MNDRTIRLHRVLSDDTIWSVLFEQLWLGAGHAVPPAVTAVTAGKTYYYKVRSQNEVGYSAFSAVAGSGRRAA